MDILILLASVLFIAMVALQIRIYKKLKTQTAVLDAQRKDQESQKRLLNDLISEKEQLIGLVSHDLKGPFNRIYALVQLLSMSSSNLTEEQLDYLGKIHQISSDGLAMLRNLLDNRRIEDKGIEVSFERLSLTLLVTNLVKNYRALAEKKKIKIIFNTKDELIIYSDKISINRIIENLLSNALKFSASGSSIYVELFKTEESIQLSVVDEGPGISQEDQQKLFLKYQRLSARPTAGESSTGLGLFLVKSMIEKIGGKVTYEGDLGKGSRFNVFFNSVD